MSSTYPLAGSQAPFRAFAASLTLPHLIRASDVFSICLMGFFSFYVVDASVLDRSTSLSASMTFGAVVGVLFFGVSQLRDDYELDVLKNAPIQVRSICVSWLGVWVLLGFMAFALKSTGDFSRLSVGVMIAATPVALILGRRVVARVFLCAVRRGIVAHDQVAMLQVGCGVDIPATVLAEFSIVHSQVLAGDDLRALACGLTDFVRAAAAAKARKVVIQLPTAHLSLTDHLSEHLRRLPIPSMIVTEEWLTRAFQRPAVLIGELTAFELQAPPLTPLQRAQKRILDLTTAFLGLLLLSPLMIFVALAVKLEAPGPILFRQRRLGFNGKEFQILKFRSMRVLEDGEDVRQAARHDDRVTRVGRFIRATSIDELPQLLNVVRGDMSLIGPRPHARAHDDQFDRQIGDYSLRRHMKPGLTGWAQVNGHRGETPTTAHMSARVEHDLWYIANWSIWLDIWIMLRTAKELVTNRDVY